MHNTKIKIPVTCPQNWNAMTPGGDGRYCNASDKIVVDFTVMKDREILDYFKSNTHHRICGHFKTTQIQTNNFEKKSFLISLHQKFKTLKSTPLRYVSLIVLGFVMTLAGCTSNTTTGETMPEDDTTTEQTLTGDTVYMDDNLQPTGKQEKDSSESTLTGEVSSGE